jgi:c-di-GMP-binding flagellar brake protein YcgR
MKERRQYERFSLTIPARMEMMMSSRKQIFDFETRDISAGGAFIDTMEQFPEGIRFKLDLTISSQKIKELTGAKSLIECEGNVVRSTPKGVAVHFDRECQILSLRGL